MLQGCSACACFPERPVTPPKRCAVMQESVPGQLVQCMTILLNACIICIFQSCSFFGFQESACSFQKGHALNSEISQPCLVAVHVRCWPSRHLGSDHPVLACRTPCGAWGFRGFPKVIFSNDSPWPTLILVCLKVMFLSEENGWTLFSHVVIFGVGECHWGRCGIGDPPSAAVWKPSPCAWCGEGAVFRIVATGVDLWHGKDQRGMVSKIIVNCFGYGFRYDFLCQYKFWYDFGMGFVEFPFFWPVLVSGCLQIELPACFDGNKQENYKKLLCLFWSNSCQKPINIHIWSCIDITSKRNPISRSVTIYLSHFSAILIS